MINKPVGQTPLQALDQLRCDQPELVDTKLSYAGRLDPMAEGLLLVLVGDENKDRAKYLGLDKEYEIDVLFGVETDSYDILGMLSKFSGKFNIANNHNLLIETIKNFKGKIKLPYPPYSSKPVDGVPLFEWAKKGQLDKIKIPTQNAEIYSIVFLDNYKINKRDFENYIYKSIDLVAGDFRQEAIKQKWRNFFNDSAPKDFEVVRLRINCSSGAYMRSIAHELGKLTGSKAIALKIKRTKIDKFELKNPT